MVALNKLLNVFIFILAIASVYFSMKLHNERTVIVADRGRLLETIETIASSTGRGVNGDFNTEDTQKAAVEAVASVLKQKDALADTIASVGKGVKIADGLLDTTDLKGTDEEAMKVSATAIVKAAQDIAARDEKIVKRIQAWGEELGAPVNIDQLASLDGCEKPLTEVQTALFDMKSKGDVFVTTLQEGMGKIGNYEWSYSPDELTLASEFKSALEKYKADMSTISEQLGSVRSLEETIETKDGEITELKVTVKERNTEIVDFKSSLAQKEKQVVELDTKLKEYTEFGRLDPSVIGEVVSVNKEYGFVVTNLNEKKTRVNQTMYVRRGEQYIASVLISAVDDNSSVAEILPSLKEGDVQVGDKIIFTTGK